MDAVVQKERDEMSWDVIFQDFPTSIKSVEDIPNDFRPAHLCSRSYYEKMVAELFPKINNRDRSWMILDESTYSIEFNSGREDPIDSLMLHVRGDEKAINAIYSICKYTNWRAIDCSAGDFIDFENNPDEGFNKWREYRDQVTK